MYNEKRDFLDEKVEELMDGCICPHCIKELLEEIFMMAVNCGTDILVDEITEAGFLVKFDEDGSVYDIDVVEEESELELMIDDYAEVIGYCEDKEDVKDALVAMVEELLDEEE